MLPSETMIWQPEFTDKTLSRKPGAVHFSDFFWGNGTQEPVTTSTSFNTQSPTQANLPVRFVRRTDLSVQGNYPAMEITKKTPGYPRQPSSGQLASINIFISVR
ncbi:hypothetical protein FRV13_10695 [Escherichia coli]|nr:hypothetical protein FRV13_10695 [Escherichia coli]